MRACCVSGCNNKTDVRFIIPSEKRVQDIWVKRAENPKLSAHRGKRSLNNYPICGIHFHDMCKEGPRKLKKFALPTLNLPHPIESNEGNCFSYPPIEKKYETPPKIRAILGECLKSGSSSLLTDEGPSPTLQIPERVYGPPVKKIRLFDDSPSTSGIQCQHNSGLNKTPVERFPWLREHNYSKQPIAHAP